MKIGVVLGSVRKVRRGASVATWVMEAARQRSDATFELIDLKDHPLPLVDDDVVPTTRGKKYPDSDVQRFSDTLDACDGYVFITAEYNHSVPGAFKNAIDHLGAELHFKPLALISYGSEGGVRAVEHWRQIAGNFNMWAVRNQISLSMFTEFDQFEVTPNERRNDELTGLLDALVEAVKQLRPAVGERPASDEESQ